MISTKRKEHAYNAESNEQVQGLKIPVEVAGNETATANGGPTIYGEALLSEVVAEPTIDRYLDRSPKLNTAQDYEQMVVNLQRKRAAFITAEQKRKEPKIEGDTPDDETV